MEGKLREVDKFAQEYKVVSDRPALSMFSFA